MLVVALTVTAAAAQNRPAAAKVRSVKRTCDAATDSGTANKAMGQLRELLANWPQDPELVQLQQQCAAVAREQNKKEDQLYDQAVADYQRGAIEEARTKFQSLARRDTAHTSDATDYLNRISGRSNAPAPVAGVATQQDYKALERGQMLFEAQKYAEAKAVLTPLLDKSGVGLDAKKILDRITANDRHADLLMKGNDALRQRRCDDSYRMFQQIKQENPSFVGLSKALNDWGKQCGAPPADTPPAATQAATEQDDSVERAQGHVNQGETAMQKRDYSRAYQHFVRAQKLLPDDADITRQLERARVELKKSGQSAEAQQAAEMAAVLEDAIQEFYAGKYTAAGQLFAQYASSNAKHRAAAAFFAGAAALSEYILGGQLDKNQKERASHWFERTRQLDPRFQPPAEAVSPKIVAAFRAATESR